MKDDQGDDTYIAAPPTESDQINPTIALSIPGDLPETIIVNGVTYRREFDWIDQQVNEIRNFEAIAERTGLSLRQAIWFCQDRSVDNVLPD